MSLLKIAELILTLILAWTTHRAATEPERKRANAEKTYKDLGDAVLSRDDTRAGELADSILRDHEAYLWGLGT